VFRSGTKRWAEIVLCNPAVLGTRRRLTRRSSGNLVGSSGSDCRTRWLLNWWIVRLSKRKNCLEALCQSAVSPSRVASDVSVDLPVDGAGV
jgi:hypothetical protein